MAKVYADLVIKGVKTIDDVPAKLKSQVLDIVNTTIQYYVEQIKAGLKTIDDVPVGIKEQVEEIIHG